jgi:hypothetical protein
VKVLAATIVTICLMSVLADVQERRAFDKGVRTTLCAQEAADGHSGARSCLALPDGQRSYAVRLGREIADRAR